MGNSRSASSSAVSDRGHGRQRPEPRELLLVGLWGATTAVIAYALSFGSMPIFVLNMFVIGALVRLGAYFVVKWRGQKPPSGWWT
jgi:uncharacterized OsmC-like protein